MECKPVADQRGAWIAGGHTNLGRAGQSDVGSNRHDNPAAFKKLRELLMMTFVVRGKAFDSLGPLEADALIQQISEGLKAKLGSTAKGRFGGAGG